jgi:DNA invertase Pin-like site-specific DNA recombinase
LTFTRTGFPGSVRNTIAALKAAGCGVIRSEKRSGSSTGNIYGELTVNLLGCFAEFETNLRKERQAEGIAKAKAAGVYKGRPSTIDASKVRELKQKGFGASEIAKALKIGRASVYRALES